MRLLAPGLTLATVPSLLVALDDPTSLRALLLGLGCLVLVLAGVALRWSAPLVVGSVVGAVLVLRELAPYAADLPPWVVIGLSGHPAAGRRRHLGEPDARRPDRDALRREPALTLSG